MRRALALLLLAGCGRTTWYRAHTTRTQYRQDRHECRRESREANAWASAKEALVANCLRARGYKSVLRADVPEDDFVERPAVAAEAVREERSTLATLRAQSPDGGAGEVRGRCSAQEISELRAAHVSESAIASACLGD